MANLNTACPKIQNNNRVCWRYSHYRLRNTSNSLADAQTASMCYYVPKKKYIPPPPGAVEVVKVHSKFSWHYYCCYHHYQPSNDAVHSLLRRIRQVPGSKLKYRSKDGLQRLRYFVVSPRPPNANFGIVLQITPRSPPFKIIIH